MNKMIVFDLDGTLVDFYGVDNWLDYLQNKDATPYKVASPLYDADTLNVLFDALRGIGYRIAVTSWLAKTSDRIFDQKIRNAKYAWIKAQGLIFDEIHIVKYGTPKATVTEKANCYQILVDDEEPNRNAWTLGDTIDANKNVIEELFKLIEREI